MANLRAAAVTVLLVAAVVGVVLAAGGYFDQGSQTTVATGTDDGIIRSLNASANANGVGSLSVEFYNHTGAFDLRVIDADNRISMWRVDSGQTRLEISFFKLRDLPLRIVAEGAEDSTIGSGKVVRADAG